MAMYWSVLEGSAAAGSADEGLQHVAVDLREGRCLRDRSQVVDTEFKTELL